MRALNKSALLLLVTAFAGCGQQLVDFANTTNPTVSLTDPADLAVGVGVSRTVNATFSEAMDPASITTTSFKVAQGTTPVAGTVTYSGMTATFTPSADFSSNVFTATISVAAKSAGTQNGLLADYVWSFTTKPPGSGSGPAVVSTDPLNNATGVPLNKQVTAVFNQSMDSTTITGLTFTLKQGAASIAGAVSYAGNTATFAPTNPLTSNTLYSANITTGAKNTTGAALSANYPWSFTTAAGPPPALAINLRGAASFGLASRAGLTSTGVTVVNGDVALHPTPTCTDSTGNNGASQPCLVQTYSSPTGLTVNGKIYWAGDPFDNGGTANSVTNDLQIAWNEGKNKVDTLGAIAGDQLDLKTLVPGVYHNANLGLAAGGTVTLDAQNNSNGVFIFKVDSTFVDSGTLLLKSKVLLINGAQARNVWFVTGLDATIGSGTTWNGNILAGRTVTINDGSAVLGRVLAGASGAGAITLTGAASPSRTSVTVPQ